MKHIIILGDGMADHHVASLGDKTLLQYAQPAYMNRLAREGRCGRLITVPEGFPPGSEVANTAILGSAGSCEHRLRHGRRRFCHSL